MENELSVREQIIQVCNRLFIHTDYREWDKLLTEVFAETVLFDMQSMGGGPPALLPANAICEAWEAGFAGLDAVHHLAGNYVVHIQGETAGVFCYANATHFKQSATQGRTRTFVGSYEMHLLRTLAGWRISAFKYNLKYADGNLDLT
ncbi:MAG: nuclear transport factor 2 family protein [Saprospiraceae bacterium]|nr:nuclear transport factor 2 family protein [Saprospiraceae bacterium]